MGSHQHQHGEPGPHTYPVGGYPFPVPTEDVPLGTPVAVGWVAERSTPFTTEWLVGGSNPALSPLLAVPMVVGPAMSVMYVMCVCMYVCMCACMYIFSRNVYRYYIANPPSPLSLHHSWRSGGAPGLLPDHS